MSTSDYTDGAVGRRAEALSREAAAGLPDAASLAKLAAEYFPEFRTEEGRCLVQEALASLGVTDAGSALRLAERHDFPSEAAARLDAAEGELLGATSPSAFRQAESLGVRAPAGAFEAGEKASADLFEAVLSGGDLGLIPDSDFGYPTSASQAQAAAEDFPYAFLKDARALHSEARSESGRLGEISVPPLAGETGHLSARPKYAEPGFLSQAKPLGEAVLSGDYRSLGFSPVLAPAESEISSHFFDVNAIRRDFPILSEKVNGKNLVWLDNAATTQKPQAVIDRLAYFYAHENSNVHRGAHTLAARSTDAYEGAREKVRGYLNAASSKEIVFVRGATEAVNLVAWAWARHQVGKDDEIVVSWLEHHANIVPWQQICAETGARLRVIPVDDSGQIVLSEYEKLLGPRTKLVAVTHVSNALGTVTPVAEIVALGHRRGAKVLVDGAQAVSHLAVDVRALDVDFYLFSGHKVFGPTGIGALYAKAEILEAMRPYQGGGNMIADVTFERTLYQGPPARFEAGTGNIADAVGLGAALDYVEGVGIGNISAYEHYLLEYGTEALSRIPGLRLIGTAKDKASVLSFVLAGFSTEEVGSALSREGIAVRSGHHCAQPILRRFGLESTVRPSLAFYNTTGEIDLLVSALWNLKSGRGNGLE